MNSATQIHEHSTNWLHLGVLLVGSALLRLTLFNGPIGSDDITYTARALDIANGTWTVSDYNGAMRFGFNIPVGFSVYLFGASQWAVNLWPLVCSLVEIYVVYWIALQLFDRRTALFTALLLGTLPLHVAVATRMNVDALVSCFMTLSFVFFYRAYKEDSPLFYFLTGLTAGFVFWCRELVILYIVAFFVFPLFRRLHLKNYAWFLLGGFLMLTSHIALMWLLAGDPLYFFNNVLGQVDRDFIHGTKEHDAGYYFKYLLVTPVHTWLLGPLALVGGLLILVDKKRRATAGYAVFWAVFLLVLFSVTPISLDPFRLITKQSNYLIMMVAPLSLLGGYLLARLPSKTLAVSLLLVLSGNILLASLEQQVVRTFVSNGYALIDYVESAPDVGVYGSVNNSNLAYSLAMTGNHPDASSRISTLSRLRSEGPFLEADEQFAFIDRETLGWARSDISVPDIPQCWELRLSLAPTGFGLGHEVVTALLFVAEKIPMFPPKALETLRSYHEPQGGKIYRFPIDDPWCDQSV